MRCPDKSGKTRRASADDRAPRPAGAVVLQQNDRGNGGEQAILRIQALEQDIGGAIGPKERFQRRGPALINGRIRIFRRVQLIDNIDRLRSHPELGHKE